MTYFVFAGGKIDFEYLPILEKQLENLPLEQNIFSLIYFQLTPFPTIRDGRVTIQRQIPSYRPSILERDSEKF